MNMLIETKEEFRIIAKLRFDKSIESLFEHRKQCHSCGMGWHHCVIGIEIITKALMHYERTKYNGM